ncbi:MAG: alkaline phosphatase family protein [Candidatus Binatia bacterium]
MVQLWRLRGRRHAARRELLNHPAFAVAMYVDDLILSVQRAIDRLIYRFRSSGTAPGPQRRFLVVQIDGLSRGVLDCALASRKMPFLRRLLRRGHQLEPMTVGLPTSTPAFQMSMMYGVHPDIPGFHYYDRDRRGDIHFPRPGHAAFVETKHAEGRRGILKGGSAYGCVFTGGAENNLFSFTRLTRPTGYGLLRALSPFVVLLWVCLKSLGLTVVEVARAVARLITHPRRQRHGWRWLTIKIGLSVWVRGFFTMAVSRDLYVGTPAVYVNYLDYDVAAHAFGPRSRRAFASLRRVDRSIQQLWRVLRRIPEYQYDLYILSDHGQAACTPYPEIAGGHQFERWVFERLLDPPRSKNLDGQQSGLARGIRARRREAPQLFQHFLNYLDQDFIRRSEVEAYQRDGIRVITAGPNAFFYVLDDTTPLDARALDERFPGFAEELSRSPGVGFVLARGADGAICFWRGERYRLTESDPGPFDGRPDAAVVVQGIADLMKMPSAGDLVIYGIDAPQGHVSYIPEVGAHAGPSPEEMHTFIVRPRNVSLPSPISHPIQLYDHFMRYQENPS